MKWLTGIRTYILRNHSRAAAIRYSSSILAPSSEGYIAGVSRTVLGLSGFNYNIRSLKIGKKRCPNPTGKWSSWEHKSKLSINIGKNVSVSGTWWGGIKENREKGKVPSRVDATFSLSSSRSPPIPRSTAEQHGFKKIRGKQTLACHFCKSEMIVNILRAEAGITGLGWH